MGAWVDEVSEKEDSVGGLRLYLKGIQLVNDSTTILLCIRSRFSSH